MKAEGMSRWGFNAHFEALASQYPELTAARVILQEKGIYRVVYGGGEKSAVVSGKFRYEAAALSDYPTVGDFVMLDANENGGQAVIHHLLPRTSVFIRKAAGTANEEQLVAANVDTVFICMSLNNDFNPRRLERYLSIAWESGAIPVTVLTKADLCTDTPARLTEVEAVAAGTDVLVTSSLEGDGYRSVTPYIKNGSTVAFIGSSGVGKSTLINRLLGEERLATKGLRDDDKGRHTTTHRELILLPTGGMVIDTPGMRELGMWDSAEGLERAFTDIGELAAACRFGNCTHTNEPGCAVRAAISDGTVSEERFRSWRKLKAENEYSENSESYLAEKERKFKEIAMINRSGKRKR